MSDLKNRLESILFSAGKQLTLEELSRLTKERDPEKIKQALVELKEELEKKDSSIMLVIEGDSCKLTVREKYLPFVRKVVSKTELPKSIIETLAIVAFKAPVLQSKVIHIRTNKAYKHLEFLEEKGYITREKKGRTKLIKLTQKFFEYFDVPPDKLKEKFKGFEELDAAIDKMEEPKEVDLVDEEGHKVKLKEYDTEPELEPYKETPSPTEKYVEKVDGLETYGEKAEKKKKRRKKPKKKEEKKEKKEEKPEEAEEMPEEEGEIAEEDLAAALTGEEPEVAEEEAEAVEEAAEEVAEKAKEAEEEIKKVTEKPEEKPKEEKKPEKKKKKEKKPKKEKKGKKKKEEVKEEPPKEEPRKKITAEDVKKQAKEMAATAETKEYESEGIFKGEIPKELEQKISQKAEEIVYGKKPAIEEEEKKEIEFEETPELPEEDKKEEIEQEEKEELPAPEE
jgi:segregation and condensation protein B